ncbi:MAG: glycosyltransferase family 4 protein [Armatimonadota bacterium]|nr:glycosyltransferase family 4 protein [Armatimonadota bacterium]
MKVLVCNKFYRPYGGPETQVLETSRLLEADGHEVVPFSMSHPDNWPSPWSGYFVPRIDYHGNPGPIAGIREAANIIYSREARRRITRLLDAARPDIAHMHNIYHQLSPSIFGPVKKRGVPIVMSLHDYKLACPNMLFYVDGDVCERCSGGRFRNAVIHKCVFGSSPRSAVCAVEMYIHRFLRVYQRSVDVFISPSRFLIDILTRCGAAGPRMVHVPALANVDAYTPTYENDGYVFCLGKLTPEKGIATLIRAVALISDTRLVVAGTGAQREELERLAQELAPGRVEFVGFLSGETLRRAMERCAVFVIPSVWYENCPATVLEAYSAGKPVIGSRIGGIPELVDEGSDGLLFEPGNHEELAVKISSLLADGASIVEMGRAGRGKMESKYSRREHYKRLIEIYRELVPGWPDAIS